MIHTFYHTNEDVVDPMQKLKKIYNGKYNFSDTRTKNELSTRRADVAELPITIGPAGNS